VSEPPDPWPATADTSESLRRATGDAPGADEGTGDAFRSVVRTPVHAQVADQIREAIVAKRLVPGQALPTERELTARFGVSRTSVREALRTLEAEGWLAGRTVVTDDPRVSLDFGRLLRVGAISVLDLVYFRSMLEREGIVKAALADDPARWDPVREALDAMADAGDSMESFLTAYLAFHRALVVVGGNRISVLTMEATHAALDDHVHECFRQIADGPQRARTLDVLHREHAEILDAAVAPDAGRACDLLDAHFRHFYATLLTSSLDGPAVREPLVDG
jgi:GntR family transcriptional repressor for pyruvate dehydrogenase complex